MQYDVNDIYIGRSLELYGEFSEDEVRLFAKIVSARDVVVDVGANLGPHTVPLSQLAHEVWALEPQPSAFAHLCANVTGNGRTNVHCLNVAAGRKARPIAVPQFEQDTLFNFGGVELFHDWSTSGCRTATVPLIPLDSLGLRRCDFMKIDVEGMELDVLQGGAETIARTQPILYLETDRGAGQADVVTHLQSLGYRIWPHQPPLYRRDNYFGNPCNVFGEIVSLNLLCTPTRRRHDLQPENLGLREI